MRDAPTPGWRLATLSLLLLMGLAWAAPALSQDRGAPQQKAQTKRGKTPQLPGLRGKAGAFGLGAAAGPGQDEDEDDDPSDERPSDEATRARYLKEGLGPVHLAIRQGLYRSATVRLRVLVESDPDNSIYHALLGQAWAKEGEYGDAIAEFRFAQGDLYYEQMGIGEHADALRALGRPLEAAALRATQLATVDAIGDEAHIIVELGRDYWAAGDLARAEELFEEAISITPRGAKPLCALGRFLWETGRKDEAWFYLHQARRFDSNGVDTVLFNIRVFIDDYRWEEADVALTRLRRHNPRLEAVILLRAELSLLEGTSSESLNMFNMQRWSGRSSPEMLAMRARLLQANKQPKAAADVLERAWRLYSKNPVVQAAAAELGWKPRPSLL